MRRALFIFVAMMVYAIWAVAQESPKAKPTWWQQFTAVPPGVELATETPGPDKTPTPTYTASSTWVPSPTPTGPLEEPGKPHPGQKPMQEQPEFQEIPKETPTMIRPSPARPRHHSPEPTISPGEPTKPE